MVASQSRLLKPLRPVRLVALVLTGLFLLLAHFPAAMSAQEPRITKTNLLDSLKNRARHRADRMTASRYVEWIKQRGVDFQVTAADEQDIRNAGSYFTVAQLDELITAVRDNYRPEPTALLGTIEEVEVVQNPGGGVQVFLRLLIRNDGPPTTAQKYRLQINHQTSKSIDFKSGPSELKERYTLPQDKGSEEIIIQPQDAIARKTAEAIPRGRTVSGWMRFVLPLPLLKPEFMRQSGIRYTLSFADATGKSYSITYNTP